MWNNGSPRTKAERLDMQTREIEALTTKEGAELTEYGPLKILRWTETPRDKTKYVLKVFKGTACRPLAFYLFSSSEKRGEYVQKLCEDCSQHEDYQKERKAKQTQEQAKVTETIQVGTILHYSWGYDQTNCEFYEVIEKRSAHTVVIREIGAKHIHSRGVSDMAEYLSPDPGNYVGPPITKRVGPYGISMDFGTASPTTVGAEHYSSWYA